MFNYVKLAVIISLLIGVSNSASADTLERIAYSKKMGVEVLGRTSDGADWCREKVDIVLKAKAPEFYTTPQLNKLISQLGKILPNDCPKIKRISVVGQGESSADIVYNGTAEAENNWALQKVSKSTTADKVVSATPDPLTETASKDTAQSALEEPKKAKDSSAQPTAEAPEQQSEPQQIQVSNKPLDKQTLKEVYDSVPEFSDFGNGGKFNLIGDWHGKYTCTERDGKVNHEYTLSIYQQKGEAYKAYLFWDTYGVGSGGIFDGGGFYLQAHNKFSYETSDTILSGQVRSAQIDAKYDPQNKSFVSVTNKNCTSGVLIKKNIKPLRTMVHKKSLKFAEMATDWAFAQNIRGSVIGKLPAGKTVFPGCQGFLDWANSFPTNKNQRLEINSTDRGRILLHFQDEASVKYFGSPAYYWSSGQRKQLSNIFNKCNIEYDIRRSATDVFNDYNTWAAISERRKIDQIIAIRSTAWIKSGLSQAEIYSHLSKISADDEKLFADLKNSLLYKGATNTDYYVAKATMKRFAELYAVLVLNEYEENGKNIATDATPFIKARHLLESIDQIKGSDVSIEAAKTEAKNAVNKAVREIEEQKATEIIASWSEGFNDFTQVVAAKEQISALKKEVGSLLSENTEGNLDKEFLAIVLTSVSKILSSEQADLDATPFTRAHHLLKLIDQVNGSDVIEAAKTEVKNAVNKAVHEIEKQKATEIIASWSEGFNDFTQVVAAKEQISALKEEVGSLLSENTEENLNKGFLAIVLTSASKILSSEQADLDDATPFTRAHHLLKLIDQVNGSDVSIEDAKTKVKNAVNKAVREIEKQKASEIIASWSEGFNDFNQVEAAKEQISDIKEEAGSLLSENTEENLNKEFLDIVLTSASKILSSEQADLDDATPFTRAHHLLEYIDQVNGSDVIEAAKTKVKNAVNKAVREIEKQKTSEIIASWSEGFNDFNQVEAAKEQISDIKKEAGSLLSENTEENLNKEFLDIVLTSAFKILSSEQAKHDASTPFIKARHLLEWKARHLLKSIDQVNGSDVIEAAKTEAKNAVNKAVREIEKQKASEIIASWSEGFNDFNQVKAVKEQISDIKKAAGSLLSENTEENLNKEFLDIVLTSASKILSSEQAKLDVKSKDIGGDTPLSVEQVTQTLEMLVKTENDFKDVGLEDQKVTYLKQANKLRDQLVDIVIQQFKDEFEKVSAQDIIKSTVENWVSLMQEFEILPKKFQDLFGSYPVESKVKESLKPARKALDDKLKFALKTKMSERFEREDTDYLNLTELKVLTDAVSKPMYPFKEAFMSNLNKFQVEYAKDLLDNVAEKQVKTVKFFARRVENELQDAMKSPETADEFYQLWGASKSLSRGLMPLAKEHDELDGLQEEWEGAEKLMSEEICKTEYGLNSDDIDLPVLAGSGLTSLGNLVCAHKITGSNLVDFDTPGLIWDDFYTLKFLTPKGYTTLKMKMLELGPEREGLIGFSASDGVEEKNLSRKDWATVALIILGGAEAITDADLGTRELGLKFVNTLDRSQEQKARKILENFFIGK